MQALIHFDGSYRLIDKRMGMQGGWTAALITTKPTIYARGTSPVRTNKNGTSVQAEWLGLQAALIWINSIQGVNRLVICGDCEAVIGVLTSKQAKASNSIAGECLAMLRKMGIPYIARWIQRRDNHQADRMSHDPHFYPRLVLNQRELASREQLLKIVAEYLWQQAGQPNDQDEQLWYAAEAMLRKAGGL